MKRDRSNEVAKKPQMDRGLWLQIISVEVARCGGAQLGSGPKKLERNVSITEDSNSTGDKRTRKTRAAGRSNALGSGKKVCPGKRGRRACEKHTRRILGNQSVIL